MKIEIDSIIGSKFTIDKQDLDRGGYAQKHAVIERVLDNWLSEFRKKDFIDVSEFNNEKTFEIQVAVLTLKEAQDISMYIKELEDKVNHYESEESFRTDKEHAKEGILNQFERMITVAQAYGELVSEGKIPADLFTANKKIDLKELRSQINELPRYTNHTRGIMPIEIETVNYRKVLEILDEVQEGTE